MEPSDFLEVEELLRKNAECTEEHERLRKAKKKSMFWGILAYALLFSCFASLISLGGAYIRRSDNGGVVDKETIKISLRSAIRNGADLNVLKHIYSRRQVEKPFVVRDRSKYYSYETAFSLVLEDLRGDYFSSSQFKGDSLYRDRLDKIIKDNNNRNPFDQLEESQRYYFNNVITKSAENYSKIQEDINNIANELQEKNLLVSQYLSRSSYSFYLSIAALIITLVSFLVPVIRVRKPKKKTESNLTSEKEVGRS